MAGREIAEFAALVKELKERSGDSYGTLAGKLHVSTSTLHRYCNGDAVPAEFAPVARLATVCGAGREEQVELHRRWILADEARRRPAGDAVMPEVAPQPGTGAGTGPEAEAVADGAGAPPRAGRRNLRIALAAAAVVALGVPTAYVAARDGSDKGGGRAAAADSASPSVSADGGADGANATASPSGSVSPSVSASRTASPSATASHGAGGGGSAVGSGVPVSVGVSSYNWDGPCDQYYVLDQPPTAVPPPPSDPQDNRSWARALGGVDGGGIMLQVTATGKSKESVVLTGLRVRTVARSAPLAWTAYSMGDGCGSGVTPRSFDVDLDSAQALTRPVGGVQGDVKIPAVDFPYKVASDDPQVLNLNVHSDARDVSWYLELSWSTGGRSGKVRVDDGGKPFRTSAVKGRPLYLYNRESNVWEQKAAD
ncbi:helix-turn-helix transcriptional regulator [Streptomyces sp. NPDC050738]|uniref:helix-turn-helix domain-containing protein n=1 Tax=Streptomyces sp. NPDC050738 TaxID=3154744 RepID=UPI0034300EF2